MGKLLFYIGLAGLALLAALNSKYETDSDGKIWFGDKDDCDCDSHD
jgi:hypothetical protein